MILIVDKSKTERDTVAEIFHYMGILSYPVSDEAAPYEISSLFSAVLFTSVDGIPDIESYVRELRALCDIPMFLMSDEPCECFDGVFPKNSYSSSVAEGMSEIMIARGGHEIGEYELPDLDVSARSRKVTYRGVDIPFTKTEKMILKLLIRAYPGHVDTEGILKYAFKAARCPEASSVRTHISTVNRKFKDKFGKPLILSEPGVGYTVATVAASRRREAVGAL